MKQTPLKVEATIESLVSLKEEVRKLPMVTDMFIQNAVDRLERKIDKRIQTIQNKQNEQ